MTAIHLRTLVLLPALLSAFSGIFQSDSLSRRSLYENEVIYFSGRKYVKNNVKYPIHDITREFKVDSDGFEQLQQCKLDQRKARTYLYPGLILYISGLIVLDKNPNVATGLFGGSIICSSITLYFGSRADKKLRKAVWLRNRDVLFD